MGNKLYVGNLPYSFDSEQLGQVFSAAGTVTSAKVITDRESGRSKGFGFVEMASAQEAEACIQRFNGTEHGGRQISVSEARPQEPRSGGGGGGRGGFSRDRY